VAADDAYSGLRPLTSHCPQPCAYVSTERVAAATIAPQDLSPAASLITVTLHRSTAGHEQRLALVVECVSASPTTTIRSAWRWVFVRNRCAEKRGQDSMQDAPQSGLMRSRLVRLSAHCQRRIVAARIGVDLEVACLPIRKSATDANYLTATCYCIPQW